MIMTRTALLLLAAAPLVAQQPGATQPPPTTQMVLKGKAPVSNEVLKVTLPKAKEATLANGLRVMVLENHRVPQVSFQLIIPGADGIRGSTVGETTITPPPASVAMPAVAAAAQARVA